VLCIFYLCFELGFLYVEKKYRLRTFHNRVISKLNPNRDGVMEGWMELHTYSSLSSPYYVYVAMKGGQEKHKEIQLEAKGKNIFGTKHRLESV